MPQGKEMTVRKLETENDIWVLTPQPEDLKAAAYYAAVSLPWTFNRMMLTTKSPGQQRRALNIAKGILGQEMLKRKLEQIGITAQTQRKSYRDEDLFDFNVEIKGSPTKVDLKSFNYYTDYDSVGRESFSVEFLTRHLGHADAEWTKFFPMLVPHTQIDQDKEAYCFAIAKSIDTRNDIETDRMDYVLTAFPHGEHLRFLSSSKLCLRREEENRGFYIDVLHNNELLFDSVVTISVIGEWQGKSKIIEVHLEPNKEHRVGPFSCISSFKLEPDSYGRLHGSIQISVGRNDFTNPVLNSQRRNTNVVPSETFELMRRDFCNLFLPTDYTLYVLGWTYKDQFLEACKRYTGWVWPKDSVDKYRNQPWTQITESDRLTLEAKGFGASIRGTPPLVRAGWVKTTGRGGGACCYVFPNIGANGGVKETNLYILPQDLYTMDSLKE